MATHDVEPKRYSLRSTEQREEHARIRESSSRNYAPYSDEASTSTTSSRRSVHPNESPRFVIDRSLPPEQRYLEVCSAFQSEMLNLTSLFDEVVGDFFSFLPVGWLHFICKVMLRRVYDKEENAELKGISKATGVDMYLLVCFNVLLDLFMGCSSGGAVVRDGDDGSSRSKMLHFRTLDWGMPSLRRVIVQLDFVDKKGGPIIASSITYAGYVGVLTGVRKDFSISLNFRPNRVDNGMYWQDKKYQWHLLMVLLGKRQSISSLLRHFLLPQPERRKVASWLPLTKQGEKKSLDYDSIVKIVGGEEGKSTAITTTACYLCICNGQETTTVEKDRISAVVRSSDEFIVVTNNDEDGIGGSSGTETEAAEKSAKTTPTISSGNVLVGIEEADDRKERACNTWEKLRAAKARANNNTSNADIKTLCTVDDIVQLVQRYPTTNECTHFACVMDPTEGTVAWCRVWKKPVGARWIREHASDTW